jgi:hypothetical protein
MNTRPITCPTCSHVFTVSVDARTAICPRCGKALPILAAKISFTDEEVALPRRRTEIDATEQPNAKLARIPLRKSGAREGEHATRADLPPPPLPPVGKGPPPIPRPASKDYDVAILPRDHPGRSPDSFRVETGVDLPHRPTGAPIDLSFYNVRRPGEQEDDPTVGTDDWPTIPGSLPPTGSPSQQFPVELRAADGELIPVESAPSSSSDEQVVEDDWAPRDPEQVVEDDWAPPPVEPAEGLADWAADGGQIQVSEDGWDEPAEPQEWVEQGDAQYAQPDDGWTEDEAPEPIDELPTSPEGMAAATLSPALPAHEPRRSRSPASVPQPAIDELPDDLAMQPPPTAAIVVPQTPQKNRPILTPPPPRGVIVPPPPPDMPQTGVTGLTSPSPIARSKSGFHRDMSPSQRVAALSSAIEDEVSTSGETLLPPPDEEAQVSFGKVSTFTAVGLGPAESDDAPLKLPKEDTGIMVFVPDKPIEEISAGDAHGSSQKPPVGVVAAAGVFGPGPTAELAPISRRPVAARGHGVALKPDASQQKRSLLPLIIGAAALVVLVVVGILIYHYRSS